VETSSVEQLVKAAQGGCIESFGRLYTRYYSAMVAIGYSLLGDKSLAEDAAQETFVKAAIKLKHLRKPKSFGKWLSMICRIQLSRFSVKTAK
jgi:DNA-directed RNA polymerase specialized sigma24 family protein